MQAFSLFLAWLLFFLLHSALASGKVKRFCKAGQGRSAAAYRLFYNTAALLSFAAVLLLDSFYKKEPWFSFGFLGAGIGALLLFLGFITAFLSFRNYDLKEFSGIDFWSPSKKDQAFQLKQNGLNRRLRHPLYLGVVLSSLGAFLLFPGLFAGTFFSALLCYLPLGIKWEEDKLLSIFGEKYRQYRIEVPYKVLPFIW